MNANNDVILLTTNQYVAKFQVPRSTLNRWLKLGLMVEGKHYITLPNKHRRFIDDLGVYRSKVFEEAQEQRVATPIKISAKPEKAPKDGVRINMGAPWKA